MKLSIAIMAAALLCGCSTHVMQPEVNSPTKSEEPKAEVQSKEEESPCMEHLQEMANQTAEYLQQKYNEAKDSETVKDAKEAAKKAGQELYEKANKYWETAKDAVNE